MAFSYVDEKNIGDAYEDSKKKYASALANVDEYERIALNKPKDNFFIFNSPPWILFLSCSPTIPI